MILLTQMVFAWCQASGRLLKYFAKKGETMSSIISCQMAADTGLVSDREAVSSVEGSGFDLVANLGAIIVPDDYAHERQFDLFVERYGGSFNFILKKLNKRNLPKPSRILSPGERLRVRLFRRVMPGKATSDECLAFLARQKAVHVGIQGMSIVWDQCHNRLLKDCWCNLFDEKSVLFMGRDNFHTVPSVKVVSRDRFEFRFRVFEDFFTGGEPFFCFTELPAEVLAEDFD